MRGWASASSVVLFEDVGGAEGAVEVNLGPVQVSVAGPEREVSARAWLLWSRVLALSWLCVRKNGRWKGKSIFIGTFRRIGGRKAQITIRRVFMMLCPYRVQILEGWGMELVLLEVERNVFGCSLGLLRLILEWQAGRARRSQTFEWRFPRPGQTLFFCHSELLWGFGLSSWLRCLLKKLSWRPLRSTRVVLWQASRSDEVLGNSNGLYKSVCVSDAAHQLNLQVVIFYFLVEYFHNTPDHRRLAAPSVDFEPVVLAILADPNLCPFLLINKQHVFCNNEWPKLLEYAFETFQTVENQTDALLERELGLSLADWVDFLNENSEILCSVLVLNNFYVMHPWYVALFNGPPSIRLNVLF